MAFRLAGRLRRCCHGAVWRDKTVLDSAVRTADHAAASADRVLRWLVNVRLAAMPSHLSAEIDIPEFRVHGLSGRVTDHWSIWVNGSWTGAFRFIDGDEELLDYLENL